MNPLIFLFGALGLNICLYHIFVSVATDCVNVIALRPKLTTPKFLFYFWMKLENFSCSDAFYRLDYPCRAHCRYPLYQKMNMILISPNLNKRHFIPLRYSQANFFQTHIHSGTKHYSSVFGRTNKMI